VDKRWQISRRRVLRGLGAAVALPMLDAMRPALPLAVAGSQMRPPQRMAFLLVPNGVHVPDWTPQSIGYDFQLPHILEPLHRVQDDLLVLTGLTHHKGRPNGDAAGDHARACATFLTGCQARKTHGANLRVGISADQIAAQQIGQATRFGSLELGCERLGLSGNCDSGYSCAYSSAISWSSVNTPLAKEVDPRAVFERLFSNPDTGEAKRDLYRKSILDFVAEDARSLKNRLGRTDQQKLDEYLTGVRQIEQRIVRAELQGRSQLLNPTGLKKPTGIPDDYQEHVRLMGDLMVLAFQNDLTRVCTFMMANEGSNKTYRFLGVPEGHHQLSHHGNDPEKQNKIRKINRFHVTQFAYIVERLKSIQEADGSTLLDNSMVLYGSDMSDGNAHNNENLPILLAGQGGGTIDSGRHVRYEQETPMSNLLVSMLNRVGAKVDQIGDSTGPLDGLV